MKICILTQPLGTNYGGVLQAFALQKVLRDLGHDVTTLRWIPEKARDYKVMARRFLSKYLKGNRDIVYFDYNKQIHFTFREQDRFIDEHLQCLNVKAPLLEHSLPDFDAYIVGSDQVWRPMYSPFLPNFYLDFLGNASVKRIAYAASFGVDVWETDERATEIIRPLAQKFDSISVREESGIHLCLEKLGVQAQVMPDPTLLLKADDYLQLCRLNQTEQEPYIAAYILDEGDREQRFVERLSQELGLPVRYLGQLDWVHGVDSIESWLDGIARAKYIVTNSFHGTVFSILFEKNFVSIINSARGTSRFESLLDAVGLRNRLIEQNKLEETDLIIQDIDYQATSDTIQRMRHHGISYLKTVLSEQ